MTNTFDAHHLPAQPYELYRKLLPTRMWRIDGPFTCLTIDGNWATCKDGWLALDAQGHPYPIASTEQACNYESVDEPLATQ
jgi:hypothetical protein